MKSRKFPTASSPANLIEIPYSKNLELSAMIPSIKDGEIRLVLISMNHPKNQKLQHTASFIVSKNAQVVFRGTHRLTISKLFKL